MKEIDQLVNEASNAFGFWAGRSAGIRADLVHALANGLEADTKRLINLAHEETSLGIERLETELTRTIHQLNSYASAFAKGYYLGLSLDEGEPELRKMNRPIGPVAVFGAGNFPFAYSTPGGDTASALLSGCPVIVRAHSGHLRTSERVAAIFSGIIEEKGFPKGLFGHLSTSGNETGAALVAHPGVKAVGFTGSFKGGMALKKVSDEREEPIPVFAEMGSVNPVFLLPSALDEDIEALAKMLVSSITQSMGQFCTNPGLIVMPEHSRLDTFKACMERELNLVEPQPMLNEGIYKNFDAGRAEVLAKAGVELIAGSGDKPKAIKAWPGLASVKAADFLEEKRLHEEVFGPFSILVNCSSSGEMKAVLDSFQGQLTMTIHGSSADLQEHAYFIELMQQKAGRIIINGVPTGVRVARSIHHGGPFPATTDSRFTSVGADAILRFMRPVSFQNFPEQLLPEDLTDNGLSVNPYFLNGHLMLPLDGHI